ncbi:XdhC family protein [Jiulongibacter sediminis]|uniref:XdhC family protein n=1 Tax=Jiulongibacter sediminis TaxID=1605367 RepID=UPI0026EAC4EA|nr:XdhC family protein [Jiulongibacter sediminis]
MKEIKNIIRQFDQTPPEEKLALATVVRVEGSSYRRMGARMLVSENGNWVGGISGGCLEGDALKRSRMAILKGKASIITYDTTIDDDHQIGVGLGCNGVIDVLFTPVDRSRADNQIELLKRITGGPRKISKLLKVIRSENSDLLGELLEFTGPESLQILREDGVNIEELDQVIENLDKSKNIHLSDELSLFVEVLPPAYHLILLGHQYDLYPLLRQTIELGWDITVVAPENKVSPMGGVNLMTPEVFDSLEFDDYTAVVLMSHSLHTDKENLRKLSKKKPKYIGMLGPRVRSERIWAELAEEGDAIPADLMQNIYAPVGLEIGANTPDEIALSLLAEVKGVFAQKEIGHLRDKTQPIHERDEPMTFS